jgi:uridine kinase
VADRDLPEHADLALLAEHLALLGRGEPAEIPVWSFHEHRRVDTRVVQPGPGPVICEGLFAMHEDVAGVVDLRVYVEASAETRWGRWEVIEERGERGMGVEAAREFFETIADPTYARFAPGYRASADVIVRNDTKI